MWSIQHIHGFCKLFKNSHKHFDVEYGMSHMIKNKHRTF
jgi:hypothetical protein